MDEIRLPKKEIIFNNIFGVAVGVVCFLLVLARGIFIKNYTGEALVLEFINIFLCIGVFGIFFSQFLQSRLADVLWLSLGVFFSCIFAGLQNVLLLFFQESAVIKTHEIIALAHIVEMVFFSACCCGAVYLKMRPPQILNTNKTLIHLSIGAVLISGLISVGLFLYLPSLLQDAEHRIIFVRIGLLLFALVQCIIVLAVGLSLVNVILKKHIALIWNGCGFIFLFISNMNLYHVVREEGALIDGLIYKTGAFIIIFLGAINQYRIMFKERVEYAHLLERAISEQAQEVSQKREVFEALREKTIESQETSRMKSELLANMSHELRTPMNSIIGFTSRVIKKTEGAISDQQTKNLRTVQRNAYHLLSLINTILDISKIEAGRTEVFVEEFHIASIIDEVLEMGRSLLGGKDIALLSDAPENIVLKSDHSRVRQMLINLIGNAIKFTEQGEIKITVSCVDNVLQTTDISPREGVAISVKDTGIGIKKEDIKYVFDDYKQVDSSLTRKTGGTGLGLALVRRFSHLLGGTVTVESEYQRGTTFTVYLPLDSSEFALGGERQEGDKKVSEKSHRSILCYGVEEDLSDYYTAYLRKEGFESIMAYNIDDAFNVAREIYPRLVTVDLLSPQKKGVELIRKFKANYYTRSIPFCAAAIFHEKKQGYFLPLIDFVFKPVNKELISRILNNATHMCPDLNHVLLIDNDESALNLMHHFVLQEGDYRARMARDLEDTLHMLKNKKPDLILLNVLMPEREGFKIVAALATKKKWCDIPVVFVVSERMERGLGLTEEERKEFLHKSEIKRNDVLKKISYTMRHVL